METRTSEPAPPNEPPRRDDDAPRVRFRRLPAASAVMLVAFVNAALLFRGPLPESGVGGVDGTPRGPALAPGEVAVNASAPRLAPGSLTAVDSLVRRAARRNAFPGATWAAGRGERIERIAAAGRISWSGGAVEVDAAGTRYDLASLTKVVATTAAVMALVEDGRMELDAPVSRYLPSFGGGKKSQVTVRMLLTHTAGVRAGAPLPDYAPGDLRDWLIRRPLTLDPGEEVLYSDIGFVVLYAAAQRAAGEPLPRYLRHRVWGPLGMESTEMGLDRGCRDCAPTLVLEDGEEYAGGSYDETARRLDGLTGNAGAFSTAADLARFAAMIANEGELGGVRIYRPETVRAFTAPQPGAGTRALGWETYCAEGKVPDHKGCRRVYAFGHSGVTGTSLWIDPETRAWVVLLSNRVFQPKRDVDMQGFRRRLFNAATGRPVASE